MSFNNQVGNGFRCDTCDKIKSTMWGTTCNECRETERRHKETLAALKRKDAMDERIETLETENQRLREALKFYANNPGNDTEDGAAYEPENNPLKIRDRGSRARQTLRATREGDGT